MSEQFINALYTEEVISTEFLLPEVLTHLVTLLTGGGVGPEILTHLQEVFASVRTVYCHTAQRKSFCYQRFLLADSHLHEVFRQINVRTVYHCTVYRTSC